MANEKSAKQAFEKVQKPKDSNKPEPKKKNKTKKPTKAKAPTKATKPVDSKESKQPEIKKDNEIKAEIPIKILGTEEEKKRLVGIVNRVAKSKLGKETLELAAKEGYTVDFTEIPGCLGVCDPNKKAISIGPTFSDDRLIGTLAHEARHAGQFTRGAMPDMEHDNIKSQIMITRAMEADAQRTACVVGWDLKVQGDSSAHNAFKADNPLIAEPYEKAVEEGKNADAVAFDAALANPKAETESFNGWYDNNRIKAAYENAYYVQRLQWANSKGLDGELKFDKNHTGQDVVDKICVTADGKNYYTDDPKGLEEGKFLDVNQGTMDYLQDFMKHREEMFGMEPDKSLADVPVRDSASAGMYRGKELPDMSNDTLVKRQEDAFKKIAAKKRSVKAAKKISSVVMKRAVIAKKAMDKAKAGR